jgi:transcriptional regulator with XRE-family HTH domain
MKYKNIADYLERTGKTELKFADELGISQPFLNMIKKGTRRPNPELADKIDKLTGIPFRSLLLNRKDTAA